MSLTLEDAIILAVKHHTGQKDKAGEPYILHPLRVMNRLMDEDARIVAVLHDLLEDTDVTSDDLREAGADEKVVEAILLLTKTKEKSYSEYLWAIRENPLARKVKLADIEDNTDPSRLAKLPWELQKKLKAKYEDARVSLGVRIERGQQVPIFHGRGRDDISIYIDAFIDKNSGNVVLEGQDISRGEDYEYWLQIPAEHKDRLILELLKKHYSASADSQLKALCEEHNIPCKFSCY